MDIFQALVDQTRELRTLAEVASRNAQLIAIETHVEKLRAQHPEIEAKLDDFLGIDGLRGYLVSQYVDPERNLEDILRDIDHDFLD